MRQLFVVSLVSLLKIAVVPNLQLLVFVFLAVGIDFATGLLKAYIKKEVRTSQGFRNTVKKFTQYGFAIIASWFLTAAVKQKADGWPVEMIAFFGDGLLVFIIYIEVTSIFENLYEVDKNSVFSKFFIKPMLALLTLQIKNNPIFKAAETQENNPKNNAEQQ